MEMPLEDTPTLDFTVPEDQQKILYNQPLGHMAPEAYETPPPHEYDKHAGLEPLPGIMICFICNA